jgi:hypothetical protein
VLPRLSFVHVAYPMRRQIDLAILMVGELEFSGDNKTSAPWEWLARRVTTAELGRDWDGTGSGLGRDWDDWDSTHPSYSPTLSCTKSRSSSGRYEGRKAVVKSMCFKNIRHSWAQAVPML